MPAHLIVEKGPQQGMIIDLSDAEEWVIGKDPDLSDITLDDPELLKKHALLVRGPDGIYLKNLSSDLPALVNDEEFLEAVLLKEGDQVQVGHTLFLFSEESIPNIEEDSTLKGGYDDIFGDLDEEPVDQAEEKPEPEAEPESEPELPPAPLKTEMSAYDTIFEDEDEEEEDLPFDFGTDAPFLLKVIAGPNAGAEIGLEKGHSYTLGKDPSISDIVFQDASVSRKHALLSVSEQGDLSIEDLGSKNKTAVSSEIIHTSHKISAQDTVALGTTVFIIIERDAPQDTIYSPVRELPLQTEEEPPEEEEEEKEEEEAPPKRNWKKEPIPLKHLILAGSIAACFLIVFLSFFSLFKSSPVEVAKEDPTKEIKKALKGFEAVEFSYSPSSAKLFLVGHVLTSLQYEEMNFRLQSIPTIESVQDSVVIDDKVGKAINEVIAQDAAWKGASIQIPKAGRFVLTGYLGTSEEAVGLFEYLTVNFPYMDRLENELVVEETLRAQIQALVTEEQLGTLTFQLTNGNLVLSGQYPEGRQKEMQELVHAIGRIKGVTQLQNFASPVHANRLGIDISSEFQVGGSSMLDGKGFSVVLNGKIYTLGDHVDGMIITAIESNTILLEKDGLRYKIDYGR